MKNLPKTAPKGVAGSPQGKAHCEAFGEVLDCHADCQVSKKREVESYIAKETLGDQSYCGCKAFAETSPKAQFIIVTGFMMENCGYPCAQY